MTVSKKILLSSLFTSILVTGCGEEAEKPVRVVEPTTLISGKAIDGYLKNATFCLDLNKNDTCDLDEPTVITSNTGSFNISITQDILNQARDSRAPYLVYGGIDVETGQPFVGKLKAIVEKSKINVTPLTTMADAVYRNNSSKSIEESKTDVAKALDIEVNEVNSDFIQLARTGNLQPLNVALSTHKTLEAINSNETTKDAQSEAINKDYNILADAITSVASGGTTGLASVISESSLGGSDTNSLTQRIIEQTAAILTTEDNLEEKILFADDSSSLIKDLFDASLDIALSGASIEDKLGEFISTSNSGNSVEVESLFKEITAKVLLDQLNITADIEILEKAKELDFTKDTSAQEFLELLESSEDSLLGKTWTDIKNRFHLDFFVDIFQKEDIEVSEPILEELEKEDLTTTTSITGLIDSIKDNPIFTSLLEQIIPVADKESSSAVDDGSGDSLISTVNDKIVTAAKKKTLEILFNQFDVSDNIANDAVLDTLSNLKFDASNLSVDALITLSEATGNEQLTDIIKFLKTVV
jgi:hypothetical protein